MSDKPAAAILNRRRFLGAAGLAGTGAALSAYEMSRVAAAAAVKDALAAFDNASV